MRPIVARFPVAIVIAAQTWLMAKVLMRMVRSRRCAEAHAPRALRDVLCMALGGLHVDRIHTPMAYEWVPLCYAPLADLRAAMALAPVEVCLLYTSDAADE